MKKTKAEPAICSRGSAVVSSGYAAGHDRAGLRQDQARNPRRTPAATAEPTTLDALCGI